MDRHRRRHQRNSTRDRPLRHLEGLAGRLRHHPHRHAVPDGDDPGRLHGDVFSFWLHIDTAETTTTTAYDKLTVKANGTTLATYSNLNKNTGYAQHTFSLASFAGRPSP